MYQESNWKHNLVAQIKTSACSCFEEEAFPSLLRNVRKHHVVQNLNIYCLAMHG